MLRDADVLCAPSLGGESFGMVLTEAFAAGTPVVASDIAGYRDVVSAGVDGAARPARRRDGAGRDAARPRAGPARGSTGSRAARRVSAERYAWPRVAEQVVDGLRGRARRAGAGGRDARVPRCGSARCPPTACRAWPRSGCRPWSRRRSAAAARPLRRGVIGLAGLATVVGAVLAVDHIGPARIGDALVRSSPPWVLFGLALMCASMLLRAVSWHAILKAALPGARPKLADAVQGTTIGVLMSATLPARLGEPSRALIVARRLGPRARPLAGGARARSCPRR